MTPNTPAAGSSSDWTTAWPAGIGFQNSVAIGTPSLFISGEETSPGSISDSNARRASVR